LVLASRQLNCVWHQKGKDNTGAEYHGEILIRAGSGYPDRHLFPENSFSSDIRQCAIWSHPVQPNTLSKNDQEIFTLKKSVGHFGFLYIESLWRFGLEIIQQ